MDESIRTVLNDIARKYGTPCYVYFMDAIRSRLVDLHNAFGRRFAISYAVKSNPSHAIVARIRDSVATLDVSSIGEAERGLRAGYPAARLSFSGPAKRMFELRRGVELKLGEFVCESKWEIDALERVAEERKRRVSILIRINPQKMPRKFGVHMAGKASQFGIDEEEVNEALSRLPSCRHLHLKGFHIYSGTNSLSEEGIAENFGIFIELFTRFARQWGRRPEKLIFGAGFGIPYLADERPLDLQKLSDLINPQVDEMRNEPLLAESECVLELGRWIVGPAGYLLTSVVNEKHSRGVDIRMCDAGFNNQLAACGMMGTVIRRNWQFWKVNESGTEASGVYTLVGPLCTTVDTLATQIELPQLNRGDVLAIGSSGAYGFTASPTRFISHPEPHEYLVEGRDGSLQVCDVTDDGDRA